MEKISFKSFSRVQQIFLVFSFFIFLTVFSIIWGKIFAETPAITFSNVTATNIVGTGAQITWTTAEPAKFPWVSYGTNVSGGLQANNSCSNDISLLFLNHCVNLIGLIPNTVYHFSVKSSNANEIQGISADFTFTSASLPNNPPPTPSVLTGPSTGVAGSTYSYSTMLFRDPDGEQVKAIFDWGDGTPTDSSAFVTPTSGGIATPLISHSWLNAGTYTVRARAVDTREGESEWTPTFQVIISAAAPAAPTNLAATVGGSNVTLNWVDNSSNETGFKIYRGPTWTDIGNVGANVTTFVDSNRPAGVYVYHINAFNSNNIYSPISNDVSVTIASGGGGGTSCAVLNLNLNDGKTSYVIGESVNYTWTCTPGVASNVSIYLTKPDNTSTLFNSGSGSSTQTLGFSTSNLSVGSYTLKACFDSICSTVNASKTFGVVSVTNPPASPPPSTSPASSAAAGTPTPYIPLAPTNFFLNKNSTQTSVSISWKDNSDNEDKFNIERKLSNETSWLPLAKTDSNIVSYLDKTILPDISYDYRVQACLSGTGCSDYVILKGVLILKPVITPVASTTSTTPNPIPLESEIKDTSMAPITKTVAQEDATKINTVLPPLPVTASEFSSKIEGLGLVIDERKKAVDDAKEQFKNIINDGVIDIISNAGKLDNKIDISKINTLREELLNKIDSKLDSSLAFTPTDINNLKIEIKKDINKIRLAAGENIKIGQDNIFFINISSTLDTLSLAINGQADTGGGVDADLLYKDSNKDGISDYDSIYVYNIDPKTSLPSSTFEGKKISASEKILLGFDPTKSTLVKVEKEQPGDSSVESVPAYNVKEVALTEKKEVLFKGQALPNSFITIYIYSTPIIVTVKTDKNGEWQYVLDKELINGDHTIYTATVNNSGNIIAKSSGYLFTKTAEAVTLKDLPKIGAPIDATKPGLLEGVNLYLIMIIVVLIIIMLLILAGITSKKNKEKI